MRIGTVEIGESHPCAIVAEISNAHNGDRDRMGRLIDAAKSAGADIIKTQCYTPDELVALRGDGSAPEPWGSQGYTMRTLYEKAQTPLEWFPKIAAHCDRVGMPWFSSVFGAESLAALEAVDCPAYKIAHLDAQNTALAQLVLALGKPVLVSTNQRDGIAKDYWDCAQVVYCPGGYPAMPSDMHLYGGRYTDMWGLSSHCRHPLVAPVAVAQGAHYLEYHFHLEAEPSALESNVSLNEREFAAMVQAVRQTEVLIG